jgi:hypothetical protein
LGGTAKPFRPTAPARRRFRMPSPMRRVPRRAGHSGQQRRDRARRPAGVHDAGGH